MNKTKRIILIICIAVLLFGAGALSGYALTRVAGSTVMESNTAQFISADEAKAIAFKDAEISEEDAQKFKIDREHDDGIEIYEIKFNVLKANGKIKYKYEISAVDGRILNVSEQSDYNGKNTTFKQESTANGNEGISASGKYIGIDEAKSIALKHAGANPEEVSFTKAKLERDDGRMHYDIEFDFGNTEYEYEVDAISGDILDYEIDASEHH